MDHSTDVTSNYSQRHHHHLSKYLKHLDIGNYGQEHKCTYDSQEILHHTNPITQPIKEAADEIKKGHRLHSIFKVISTRS